MGKIAVVTGAAGFAGYHVTERLVKDGYFVYALLRTNSKHNERLNHFTNEELKIVYADIYEMPDLASLITEKCDIFFHLAWAGDRNDFKQQTKNIQPTVWAVEQAKHLGCEKIVCIGSQAEYGVVEEGPICENRLPQPICAYGAAKVSACYLSKVRAEQLQIEWVWGRIFSVYGQYEPGNRMLPYLVNEIKNNRDVNLSSCNQNWDYIYSSDVATAIVALAERGRSGEIYNIANGNYQCLREFVAIVIKSFDYKGKINYGEDPNPYVSLQPSVEKIKKDTGWTPQVSFDKGVELLKEYKYGME